MSKDGPASRAREVVWWCVIGAMSLIDGVAFYINISILLADQDLWTIAVVVLGCSVVAVALPTLFGSAAAQRRHGIGGSAVLLSVVGSAWLALGFVMVVVRVTSDSVGVGATGTGLDATANDAATPDANIVVAALFLLVYLTTALLAFSHTFAAVDRRALVAADRRRARAWTSLHDHPLRRTDVPDEER